MTTQKDDDKTLGAQRATADVTAGNVPQGQLPHATRVREGWLGLAAWMRAPGTIDKEDAIDACARAVENYAEYQFKLATEPTPDVADTESRLNMVSGDAAMGGIEIRFDLPDARNVSVIDEIVASNAHVHLERMAKGQWCLIVESKTQRGCFMINGKDIARSPVTTQIFWIEPVGSGDKVSEAKPADSTRRSAAPKS